MTRRGRASVRSWTALTSASVTLRRSVPLGRYPRTEAVGVPGRAPFPGVAGPRAREVRAERRRDAGVVGELLPVVGGDRVHRAAVRSRHAGHGGPDRGRGLPAGPLEKGILRRPVNQRHHGAAGARRR